MTRIIVAGILLAVVAAISITSLIYLTDTKDVLVALTDKLDELISEGFENKEESLKVIEELDSVWQERHGILSIFINHDRLEVVDTTIPRLTPLLTAESEEFIPEIRMLRSVLYHIYFNEFPKFITIF